MARSSRAAPGIALPGQRRGATCVTCARCLRLGGGPGDEPLGCTPPSAQGSKRPEASPHKASSLSSYVGFIVDQRSDFCLHMLQGVDGLKNEVGNEDLPRESKRMWCLCFRRRADVAESGKTQEP